MKGNQDYGNGCAKNMMALHVVTKHLQIWNTQQKVKKNDCKAVFLSGENPFLLRAMILFHWKETFGIKYSVNFSHFEWLWALRGWRGLRCLKCLPKWWHEQIIDRYRWRCNKRWKVAWKRQVAADSSALCRPILNIFLPVLTSCLAGS